MLRREYLKRKYTNKSLPIYSWDRIADPDAEPPGVEPGLQALIDEVRIVVQEESFMIKRAFPFYEEVLTRFLQRVFQQSVWASKHGLY
jgi:hypothetical protein